MLRSGGEASYPMVVVSFQIGGDLQDVASRFDIIPNLPSNFWENLRINDPRAWRVTS